MSERSGASMSSQTPCSSSRGTVGRPRRRFCGTCAYCWRFHNDFVAVSPVPALRRCRHSGRVKGVLSLDASGTLLACEGPSGCEDVMRFPELLQRVEQLEADFAWICDLILEGD